MPLSLTAFSELVHSPIHWFNTCDLQVHIIHSMHCALELENRHWTGKWLATKRNNWVNTDRDYKAQGKGNRQGQPAAPEDKEKTFKVHLGRSYRKKRTLGRDSIKAIQMRIHSTQNDASKQTQASEKVHAHS